MNQKLESIIRKGKMLALAGVAAMSIGCASMTHYAKPELGMVTPAPAEIQHYNPSLMIGANYGFNVKRYGVGVEAGLDYFQSASTNVQNGVTSSIKTNGLLPRIDVLFSPLDLLAPRSKVSPYLFAGVSFLNEFSKIEVPQFGVEDNVINSKIGLNAGIGSTLFDKIDLKASYIFMPTSDNVKGMVTVSAGYRFPLKTGR